jgi:hypothetical protein
MKLGIFRAFGLIIDSDLPIPGAVALSRLDAVDLSIRIGPTAFLAGANANGPYRHDAGRTLFEASEIGRYLLAEPTRMFVEPHPDATEEDVVALLIATAIPMALWTRGGLVLHASGIVLPGKQRAIALCGPSGAGKSTLAHGLLARGAKLVGDDSLWLDGEMVRGLPAACHLPTANRNIRRIVDLSMDQRVDEAELGAIIVLERRKASKLCRRVHGAESVEILLQNRHRPRIPMLLGLERGLLAECVLHAARLPIYVLGVAENDVSGAVDQIITLGEGL